MSENDEWLEEYDGNKVVVVNCLLMTLNGFSDAC